MRNHVGPSLRLQCASRSWRRRLGAPAPSAESLHKPRNLPGWHIGKAACQPTGDQHLAEALATASVQQKNAHANDTAGVILLGLPLASMSGENIAPQIEALKGDQEAVGQAMQFGNCGT